ncbi:hypothetical protein Taro_051645 [Colocasia esculenta]|uniref:Transposase Tnp1/En/Spm-like domain-containing protein n=1 Tax=Colocasia esculenta TaxID=4460 RepID=A0A843XHH1_COLES|nr:hypothetical protein [Colocasia esculenta]
MGASYSFVSVCKVADGYQAEEREQGELIVQWLVPDFALDEPKGWILTGFLLHAGFSITCCLDLISKRVKLLDMYGNIVAMGIVMSTDPTKIVMDRPIGQDFCEVAVLLANKPESPLFIKDDNRKTMKDAIGSHILWFL